MKCFPETKERGGIIESALVPIPAMRERINRSYHGALEGSLLLKQDSHLAIAGSVKARGGIYEVLKHTEDLALEHGLLTLDDNYEKLASEEARTFFWKYTIQSADMWTMTSYPIAALIIPMLIPRFPVEFSCRI